MRMLTIALTMLFAASAFAQQKGEPGKKVDIPKNVFFKGQTASQRLPA